MKTKFVDTIRGVYEGLTKQYPVTSIALIIGTLYECIYVGAELGYSNDLVNLWEFILTFLIMGQLACCFIESIPNLNREARTAGLIIDLVAAFIFTIAYTGHLFQMKVGLVEKIGVDRCYLWMVAYVLIQSILILKYGFGDSEIPFEKYITRTFVKLIQISIVWVILALGLLLLGFIFGELIFDLDEWLFVPQILIIGLYVVPSAIMALRKADDEINRFFEVIIRYVLLIMTIVGALIIYMYMIKIVLIRDIPSNSVFVILAVLFFVAIPTGYMCTSFEKEGILQKIAWILPYVYAPFILLQIYSVVSRMVQYGVTASRYMGIVMILLEIIYIVVYAVRRNDMDKMLYCFIAATVISCIVPGINALSMARINQRATINRYLADPAYGMSHSKRVVGAYQYLLKSEGEEYIDAILTREQQTAISDMGLMSGQYVFRDYSERAYLNSDDSFIPVKGYEYIAGFDAYWQDYYDLSDFPIEVDGIEVGHFELTDEINSVIERHENRGDDEIIYGVDEVVVNDDCKLYVTYVEVIYDGESKEISSMRISGHIVFNENYMYDLVMEE